MTDVAVATGVLVAHEGAGFLLAPGPPGPLIVSVARHPRGLAVVVSANLRECYTLVVRSTGWTGWTFGEDVDDDLG